MRRLCLETHHSVAAQEDDSEEETLPAVARGSRWLLPAARPAGQPLGGPAGRAPGSDKQEAEAAGGAKAQINTVSSPVCFPSACSLACSRQRRMHSGACGCCPLPALPHNPFGVRRGGLRARGGKRRAG